MYLFQFSNFFFFFQSTQSSSIPYLVALDTSQAGFTKDLESLDNTNNRINDTIHLFYVKDGQTNYEDILFNVVSFLSISSIFPNLGLVYISIW